MNEEHKKMIEELFPEWEVVENLGMGNYGVVYKIAREDKKNNIALFSAVKVISIPKNDSEVNSLKANGYSHSATRDLFESIVNDFANEIRIMIAMKNKHNIVIIEDFKIDEKTDRIGWDIFIKMEYLESLEKQLRTRFLAEANVLKLGVDICTALESCASQNIIHRDIKPGNIFMVPGEYNMSYDSEDTFGYNDNFSFTEHRVNEFKLGDFGIARKLELTDKASALSVKGTPPYMAPELVNMKGSNHTVDIYSLGIVMYQLLNKNKIPFMDVYDAPHAIGFEEAIRLRIEGKKDIPSPIDASDEISKVILKACEYEPKNRYQTAKEFKEALIGGPIPPPPPPKKRIIMTIITIIIPIIIIGIIFVLQFRSHSSNGDGDNSTPTPITVTTPPTEPASEPPTPTPTESPDPPPTPTPEHPYLRYNSDDIYIGNVQVEDNKTGIFPPFENLNEYKEYTFNMIVIEGTDIIEITDENYIVPKGDGLGTGVVEISYHKTRGSSGDPPKEIFTVNVRRNAASVKLNDELSKSIANGITIGDKIKLEVHKSYDSTYDEGRYGINDDMGIVSDKVLIESLTPDFLRVDGLYIECIKEGMAKFVIKMYQNENENELTGIQSDIYEMEIISKPPFLNPDFEDIYIDTTQLGGVQKGTFLPIDNLVGYKKIHMHVITGEDIIEITEDEEIIPKSNKPGQGVIEVIFTKNKEHQKPIYEYFTINVRRNATDVKLSDESLEAIKKGIGIGKRIRLKVYKSYDGTYDEGHYGVDQYQVVVTDMVFIESLTPDLLRVDGLSIGGIKEGTARFVIKAYQYGNEDELTGVISDEYEINVK